MDEPRRWLRPAAGDLNCITKYSKIEPMKTRDQLIDDLLTLAFAEDVGDGDATTLSTIPADEMGRQQPEWKWPAWCLKNLTRS